MEKDLISIVIPIYNSEKYLSKCIDSSLKQTYKNIEIICVNDGSEDNSIEILKKYQKNNKNIFIYNQDNMGVQKARKIGFEKSKGKYIFFLDSDDWVENDAIEKLYNVLKKDNVDVVKGMYYRNIGILQKKQYKEKFELKIEKKDFNTKLYSLFFSSYKISNMIGQLIRKDFINNSFFETNLKYAEDLCFNVKLYKNINSITIIPDCIYHYVDNDKSATNSISFNQFTKRMYDIIYVNDYLIKEFENIVNKDLIYNRFIEELNNNLLLIFFVNININQKEKLFNQILSNETVNKIFNFIDNNAININRFDVYNSFKNKDLKEFNKCVKTDIFKIKFKKILKKILEF